MGGTGRCGVKFGYKDSYDRQEVQFAEFHENVSSIAELWKQHQVPVNEYQALMETLPHEHPPMTEQERESDWELFNQKIVAANLTERETIVINCLVFGGMSLSQTGTVLAQAEGRNKAFDKMTVSRCRDSGYRKLQAAFTAPNNEE